MDNTELIVRYQRHLKRRNYSSHTLKNYLNVLGHFIAWLKLPIEQVSHKDIGAYTEHLLRRKHKPKTINCHLGTIRAFCDYLIDEEGMQLVNPVKKTYRLRLPRPLPKHLKDEQVTVLFKEIKDVRDRAMFMLMLRCGLRVEEVARLTIHAIDYPRKQIFVFNGKGSKDRIVYLSEDTRLALLEYLKKRGSPKVKRMFLVQKGPMEGRPISVRGIQKRIEYYARESGVEVSCHHLRHTMATQLLNADADLVTIQDLLGHSRITTTQCYCRVSNLKVQRDYYKAIEVVLQRTQPTRENDFKTNTIRVIDNRV
jgi:site-specific recombinase XerD